MKPTASWVHGWRERLRAWPPRALAAVALCVAAALLLAPTARVSERPIGWEDLIAPLAPGQVVVRGYVLSPLRRGEEHDVVLLASRRGTPGARAGSVEVHVVDRGRWTGVAETASFGVAYEEPRSSADLDDLRAVTDALAAAIRARDPGGLGPVDAIPLRAEPDRPVAARVVDRLAGARGMAVGVAVVAATALLASLPHGLWLVSLALAGLGLALRLPNLSIPFAHDQDVQRLFTGHLPLSEIVAGRGLDDRHPPLYFLLLHVAERFGQAEAIVRAPATVAGALVGPAVVWSAWLAARASSVRAGLAGLAVTVSVPLVERSREVSEMPLFALVAMALVACLVAAHDRASRRAGVAVAATHALALWTYYLAPLVVLGALSVLAGHRRLDRWLLRWIGIGLALGAPSLGLGVWAFVRDLGPRATARAFPALAWGEHGVTEMLRLLAGETVHALGWPVLGLALVAGAVAVWRRDVAVAVPLAALAATVAGIALVAPVARVQPYYVLAVAPLAVLGLALLRADARVERGLDVVLGVALALHAIPALAGAAVLYVRPADAFAPDFAAVAAGRPERRIATVAHYDATLLAYYLARQAGVPMDWERMRPAEGGGFALDGLDKVVVPLAQSHALTASSGERAATTLEALTALEPILVIDRDAFQLEPVARRLGRCELLVRRAGGALHACGATARDIRR